MCTININCQESNKKIFTALLTQESNIPPQAEVLENTLGYTPNITKDSVSLGVYYIELESTENTYATISSTDLTCGFEIYKFDSTTYRITTSDGSTSSDEILNKTPIEIRVYN